VVFVEFVLIDIETIRVLIDLNVNYARSLAKAWLVSQPRDRGLCRSTSGVNPNQLRVIVPGGQNVAML
jgi:hypothetical protein